MKDVNGRVALQPEMTPFNLNVLLRLVEREIEALTVQGRTAANGNEGVIPSSYVMSLVTFEEIANSLKAERDVWEKSKEINSS